jgi:hypothetical protein
MLIEILPQLLEANPDNEVYLIPRVNTVEGLTQEHINKWGWRVNENGWINFPDYQTRIYRNKDSIRFKNKVHEVITGYSHYSAIPSDWNWCLLHVKDITKQISQNEMYSKL